MNASKQLELRRLVAAWSDGHGLAQAITLADQHSYLFPKRITNAQLAGLNGVVQATKTLGQLTAFTQHQGMRAARAGRLDVQGYWDALREALERLGAEAAELVVQSRVALAPASGNRESLPQVSEWLTLWLAQEFVQHLVAHSLYLGITR